MDIPARTYFLSPLNPNIGHALQARDQYLNLLRVDIQPARLPDILDAFQVASYDSSNSSLHSLAESLRTNASEFPLDFDTSINDANHISVLHTLSFTRPCLIPERRTDFSVYFALDTNGAGTLFPDLALFIQALAQRLNRWSVLDNADQCSLRSPAHPRLQDLAYCWDGVTSAYGVLQFTASRVSVSNIRRMFHQTSSICNPYCYFHRYEYFANGFFLDLDLASISLAFQQMEVAAQELCDGRILTIGPMDPPKRLPF